MATLIVSLLIAAIGVFGCDSNVNMSAPFELYIIAMLVG